MEVFGGAVAAVVVVVLLMMCGIIVCVVIVCAVKTKHRVNGEAAPSTTPFPRSTLSLTVAHLPTHFFLVTVVHNKLLHILITMICKQDMIESIFSAV